MRLCQPHSIRDRESTKLRALITFVVADPPPFERSAVSGIDSTEVSVVTEAISELHICMRVWKDYHEPGLEKVRERHTSRMPPFTSARYVVTRAKYFSGI